VVQPVAGVVAPVNTAACVGSSATFTASATGGPLTYQWERSINNGLTYTPITGATSASLVLSGVTALMNNNLYRVVITAAPCVASVTTPAAGARLTVNALPAVTISATDLALTPGQVSTLTGSSLPGPLNPATSWSWTRNGSAITGTTNTQTADVDQMGTYRATVTDINGCVNSSNSLVIGAEVSDRLWIYPNPSNGAFQVRLYYSGSPFEYRVISVYKSNGELVTTKNFNLNNVSSQYLRMDLDLGRQAAGTYLIKVDNTITGKIVSGLVVIQRK
jgi:hypothetical protein